MNTYQENNINLNLFDNNIQNNINQNETTPQEVAILDENSIGSVTQIYNEEAIVDTSNTSENNQPRQEGITPTNLPIDNANKTNLNDGNTFINNKRGRKPKNKSTDKSYHDKYATDNIRKKVKIKLVQSNLKIANDILKSSNIIQNKEDCLQKISHDIIKSSKKENELKLLNMTLKELFSSKISTKFRKKSPDHNKKMIEKILRESQNDTIRFIFELKFKKLINIFGLPFKKWLVNPEVPFNECLNAFNSENLRLGLDISGYSNDTFELIVNNYSSVAKELFNEIKENYREEYNLEFAKRIKCISEYEKHYENLKGRASKAKQKE